MKRIVGDRDTLSSDASDLWFTETCLTLTDGDQPGAPAPRTVAAVVAQPALVPSDTLYSSQWHLNGTWGINVQQVWDEYTGQGIRVAVYDEGIDWNHVDLASRVDQSLSFDTVRLTQGGYPVEADDNHGTAVAGLIAAARNGTGAVGVAFDATLISIYQGFSVANPGNDVAAFGHARVLADVMNNSWGYGSSGIFYDNFVSTFADEGMALAYAAQAGRGGLGTNIVFAAGNYRASGDNTNYHSFQNDRHLIAVAASDSNGSIASFSTPGASILVTAPGVGIVTDDRVGSAGYTSTDYDTQFGGTSAAAPVVSGVIALMLDANPGLGYRDVQEILAYSAHQTPVTSGYQYNGAGNWNGAGLHFSNDFGAGLVDAHAAVRLAETWSTQHTAGNEYLVGLSASPNAAIPDNSTIGFSLLNSAPVDIDHVELTLSINHSRFSDLTITLTSPSGVSSVLASRPAYTDTSLTWTFDSTQFWGETGVGNWSLSITDGAPGGSGVLLSWSLALYGDVPSVNDTYVYTDEFAEMFSRDPAHATQRATLNDSDGGTDLFDGAALTGNAVIRLDGVSSTIDGHALTITNNVIENAYGGDGNDTLVGSVAANFLYGARGNDRIEGVAGDDVLSGGDGNDTLYGGTGNDTLYGGNNIDTASYADAGVRIVADLAASTVSSGADLDRLASIEALTGSAFNDTLLGGTGDDRMTGGAGNDLFVFRPFDAGNDTISDFTAGDRIDVSDFGYASIAEIQAAGGGMVQSGSDVMLTLSAGENVRLVGVTLSSMTSDRFVFVRRDSHGNNIIEADGSMQLVAAAPLYYFETGSTLGPSLKYFGTDFIAGQAGAWTPIAAEAGVGGGYDVAFRLGTADQYTVWHTDSSGNYASSPIDVVSGSDYALQSLEFVFGQDLNNNGTIGIALTQIEASGPTALGTGANRYFFEPGGTPGPSLKYLGTDFIAGQAGAWTPVAAEAVAGGGYDVAFRFGTADQYTVWRTDSSGNYVLSLTGVVSGSDPTLRALEANFVQDVNNDGTIGLALTEIEALGVTALEAGASRYFFETGGSLGPALKYLGADYIAGQAGAWAPIGTEAAAGGGYDVAFRFGVADQYTVWHTDSSGNYDSTLIGIVSGNDYTLQTLETRFNQDLNNDGRIGPVLTEIEAHGATALETGGGRYFFETGATLGPSLKYLGADFTAGQSGAWTPIGAEAATGGGYDVAFRFGAADQYTVWHTDSSGNYTSSPVGIVSGNDYALQTLETGFAQDLNNDGTTGLALTEIEAHGATALELGASHYFFETGSTLGPSLKYLGADFIAGQSGAWTPIAAEAAGGGYDVAFRFGAADQYTVWHTDSSGNYASSLTGIVSGSSYAVQSLEDIFAQDLNNDARVGPVASVIDAHGSTSLVARADEYFLDTGSTPGPSLKYLGADFIAGQSGAWTPIAAEAVADGGYEVAFKYGTTDQYTVWHTDSSGNYDSSPIGVVAGNDPTLRAFEFNFAQDVNNDGTIGLSLTEIEAHGATALEAAANRTLFETGGTIGPTLKYQGADFIAGQSGAWAPIAAEAASGGGYDVVFKYGATDQYTVWHTDSSGNYASSPIGVVSGNDPALQALEPRFDQDLNGNGFIG